MPIKEAEWFRQRSYAHFDFPLAKDKATKLVSNPQNIKQHAFMPLIADYVKSVSKKRAPSGKRIYEKKRRPIAYASHSDSYIYSFYSLKLNTLLEKQYKTDPLCSQAVLAYRKFPDGHSNTNIHFANDVFNDIKERDNCVVIALDVEGFFDNLNHLILKEAWESLLKVSRLPNDHFAVYKAATRSSAIFRPLLGEILRQPEVRRRRGNKNLKICKITTFRKHVAPKLEPFQNIIARIKKEKKAPDLTKGIPQGLPISATLANLYMLETDRFLAQYVNELNGVYRRYSDDILFIIPKKHAKQIEDTAVKEIENICLKIQQEKTQRILFQQINGKKRAFSLDDEYKSDNKLTRVEYLGFSFDGEQVLIKNSTVTRFMMKASKTIKQAQRSALAESKRLNRKPKLKKRKLFARLTTLGYGSAYGTIVYEKEKENVIPSIFPRLGFFEYAKRAQTITNSFQLTKQIAQIENQVYRLINEAEKSLQQMWCEKRGLLIEGK